MACLASPAALLCPSAIAASPLSVSFSKSSTASFRVRPIAVTLTTRRRILSVRASSPNSDTDLQDRVADSIANAMEVCEGNETSEECIVAWDQSEEMAAALADKRRAKKQADPLEAYCADNPETDECRVYED